MNGNKGINAIRTSFFGLVAAILIPIYSIQSASAVTFGTDISDPATDAPYVVSIWTSEDNDAQNSQFICSGSLIAPRIVLTAAHCTTETNSYFVKVKSPALNSNVDFITVSGVWTNPRYNPKTFVNDIGLLKLDESFEGMPFPSLANSESAKSINKFSRLRIFGWGLDQDLMQPDLLKTADLLLQDASAAKTFGKTFNVKTMLAAGKKIVSEGVWSGGCKGDSGGPLISTINGIDVIVGVTSWGSGKCLPNKPTVFNRVSYYFNDIKAGIKAVEASSVSVNRTAPIATTDPSITGEAIPGQTLKCNTGIWKNALSVQASWTSPTRLIGSSNLSVQVLPTDGGSEFKCEIVASSQNASVRRVKTKMILGKATLRSNPVIAGISSGATFKNGQVARCEGWNWTNPVDSERVTWFTASSNNPSTPVNGRMIGSGSTLTFTPEILKNEKGRYLICQVTGIKDGFESHFVSSQYISTPSAPVLGSISINYYSLNDGSSVSCSYTKPYDADELKVEWGSFTGNYFSAIPWLSGDRVSINKAVIQSAAGKSFACRVTASNLGGESVKTSYTQDTFENLPSIPSVSVSTSRSTPTSGDYANCFASNTGAYMNTVTYQWGLTRNTSTNVFEGGVLGTSSTFYFTNANLVQLSGAFLTCVVSVTNGAGTTFGNASVNIPSQSVNLPTSNPFIVASLFASNSSVAATIDIPNITNFNSSTMQAKLTVTGSPSCVDRNVDPGVRYECAGLSPNTTYSGFISIIAKSGLGIPTKSPVYSFTTSGLTGQPVYVCGQSCTGSLSSVNTQFYLTSVRQIEAIAAPGGPITSSTCLGSGCNSGTAPSLPVACVSGSNESTKVITNTSAPLTTSFRYCSAPLDTSAPVIVDASAAYTGYAKIIPTSGPAGTSIAVRFVARDNIGIASTQVRLVNPQNVAVSTVSGTFQVGSTSDGGYIANISTASSGPNNGDVYQIQAAATDGAGNMSTWFNVGTFTITSPIIDCSLSANSANSVCTNITGLDIRIVNNDSSLLKVEFCAISPSSYVWFTGGSGFYNQTIPTSTTGSTISSVYISKSTYVRNCASNGSFGSAQLVTPAPGATYKFSIDYVNNGVQFAKELNVTVPAPVLQTGLTPTLGSPTALNNYTSYTVQITNFNAGYTWSASATAGTASINGSGLVTVSNWPAATRSILTVSSSRTGYQNASASVTAQCDLSPIIQSQNITASLSGTTLTINVPSPNGWSWSVIWDGTVQRTGVTSFPLTINGFSTNKNIQLAAIDPSSNYGYSRVFLPSLSTSSQSTGPIISTGDVYIAVPSLTVGAQQTIEFSVNSQLEVTLTQLWIYDSQGNSVRIVQGTRVSGSNLVGRWKFDFVIPSTIVGGNPISKGSWQLKANANDSAGNGSSTGAWVALGTFTVE